MYKTSKIVISPRVRKSPYFDSTMKYGATAFTVYNHMYLPIVIEGPEKDYENLLKGVQLWDVSLGYYWLGYLLFSRRSHRV